MESLHKTLSAVLITGLMATGPVLAVPDYSIQDINRGVNAPSVFFHVDDGVGFLQGTVESYIDRELLINAARNLDGVEEVRNFINVSS